MSLDFHLEEVRPVEVFWRNITHNVGKMWREAGCYDALYMSNGMRAKELLPFLERGLERMRQDPATFGKLAPENGWGDYHGAVDFLAAIVTRCTEYPEATVRISK